MGDLEGDTCPDLRALPGTMFVQCCHMQERVRNVEFSDAEAIYLELVKTPVQINPEQVQT